MRLSGEQFSYLATRVDLPAVQLTSGWASLQAEPTSQARLEVMFDSGPEWTAESTLELSRQHRVGI